MKASAACIALIKRFEGFRAKPYLCPANVWTIGYGSTRYPDGRRVGSNDPAITEALAHAMLVGPLAEYERGVMRLVRAPMTQGQFDALVSFAYNVGLDEDADTIAEGLGDSTLLRLFNAGDTLGASKQFAAWNKGGGKVLPGLVERREAERRMFMGEAP